MLSETRKVNPRLEGGTFTTKGGWAGVGKMKRRLEKEDPNTLPRHSLGKYMYGYGVLAK